MRSCTLGPRWRRSASVGASPGCHAGLARADTSARELSTRAARPGDFGLGEHASLVSVGSRGGIRSRPRGQMTGFLRSWAQCSCPGRLWSCLDSSPPRDLYAVDPVPRPRGPTTWISAAFFWVSSCCRGVDQLPVRLPVGARDQPCDHDRDVADIWAGMCSSAPTEDPGSGLRDQPSSP